METFLRIVELTVPSIIVFVAVYFMVKKFFNDDYKKRFEENENLVKAFFENEEKKRAEAYKTENAKITVPLRIQAYERLVLLLERISPDSLLLRVQTPQMTAGLLHQELLITIRAEFEHNLSQQIYVSQVSWTAVKLAKDNLVRLINEEASKVAAGAPATDLSEAILTTYVNQPNNPIQNALSILKKDAENFM